MNGAKLKDVRITEETRRAIRAGIESEAYRNGKMFLFLYELLLILIKKYLKCPLAVQDQVLNLSSSLTQNSWHKHNTEHLTLLESQ
jgi:hypothetical protein